MRVAADLPLGSAPGLPIALLAIRKAFRQPGYSVLLAVAVALAVGLAACGGGADDSGGGERDAEALLDRAFAEPIPSADVDLDAQLDIAGIAGLEEPLRIRATGPYLRAERRLPQLDLDVAIEAQGAGQAIQTGVLSTGDRTFLQFGGTFYEQPREEVAATNRQLARGDRGQSGSFADLGLDASGWVLDAELEGEEEIDGVATDHVTGTLDVAAALRDINGLVRRSAGSLDAAGQQARPLRPAEIARLARAVREPTFDVYVGKEDGIVRRVSLRIDVDVPEEQRADLEGLERASIRLSAQFDDVGGDQEVVAPRRSRPLSDLTTQIGGLGGLTGQAPSAGETGSDGDTTLDAFESYAACLDAAGPEESEAIDSCRALLP